MVPNRIIHFETDKPSKQQVVIELFHQKPLDADRIENLKQRCPEQILRCNRWSTGVRIQLGEFVQQLFKRLVDHLTDRTQRMVYEDTLFKWYIAEQ